MAHTRRRFSVIVQRLRYRTRVSSQCQFLSVSASPQPAVREDGENPALVEDLAVTHRLPEEYHGVLVHQRHPGRKTLTIKAAFMDSSFEPVSSSNPPREHLEKWWQAVSKSIRDSFDHKSIPADLRAAMKSRARLYLSPVGEASDFVSGLSTGFVDLAADAPDVGLPLAKRARRSDSRSRVVATSSSSSSQVEPDAGGGRNVLYRPQPRREGRVPASGSVGALCGFSAGYEAARVESGWVCGSLE